LANDLSLPASLLALAAAFLKITFFFFRLPTILAWDLRLKVRTLTPGELWTPWARTSNG
jgi:hypothetical protein